MKARRHEARTVLLGIVLALPLAGAVKPRPRPAAIDEALNIAVEFLLDGQQDGEWPYQGVYRVNGKIPVGYRVGGTAIGGLAVLRAPVGGNAQRIQQAVGRAAAMVIASIDNPRMSHRFEATYDVRGWGYTYGLSFLLSLRGSDRMPDDLAESGDAAIRFFIDGIEATAIPESGGWSYARPAGFAAPGMSSSFMTAPTLQALFEANRQGFAVDRNVVRLAIDALEGSRSVTGAIAYKGPMTRETRDAVPGAVGRMPAAEATLYLAGRGQVSRVRGAIDAFLVHWQWLERRRAKPGTHAGRYNIAPYYFYFAHFYAAQAVELLPDPDRVEYRRRLRELLLATRGEDGTWNDRVFRQSAAYGTSVAVLSMMMPETQPPARWDADE